MHNATTAYRYEEVRNYEKILFIQNIVEMAGEGECIRCIPHIPLGCIMTKDGLKLKRDILN